MSVLSITKEQFREIYAGLPILEQEATFFTEVANGEDFGRRLASKLFRMNTLYQIVDKAGRKVQYKMNYAQHKVHADSLKHARLIILKSRQQGISTKYLIDFFDDAMFTPDLSIGLMLQDKDSAHRMLTRVKNLWDTFDPDIKQLLGISVTVDNVSTIGFSNGSIILIKTSFRSDTLHRLHISEFGAIAENYPKKAEETETGSLQAIAPNNPCVIESTAKGHNRFYKRWEAAVSAQTDSDLRKVPLPPQSFKPIFLSWMDDPTCNEDTPGFEFSTKEDEYFKKLTTEPTYTQKVFWAMKYREIVDKVYQEFPASPEEAFYQSLEGTYYATAFQVQVRNMGRIQENLYDPNLPLYVSVDLGMDGYFVLLFFQTYTPHGHEHKEFRIVDEYFNTGYGLQHYADILKNHKWADNIEKVIVPHDIEVKELGSGATRYDQWQAMGVQNMEVLEKSEVAHGIEEVLSSLRYMWVESSCTYIIQCFQNHKKEWDAQREVWKNKQLESEWAHGADAIRYMVTGAPLAPTIEHQPTRGVAV